MNVLLIYPKFPDTFWSFTYALSFIGKKAAFPPLGLLTVATLLPEEWPKRLVDVNVESLTEKDILWADIESHLYALGAEITEGCGSRVRVALKGVHAVFHRPHPRKATDKGSVKSMRRFLFATGVKDAEV